MDFQLGFNITTGAICIFSGWFGKTIWSAVRELTSDVANIRLEIATDYIRKEDFNIIAQRIYDKLESISDKLDKKVDR
jgi:hypothetical protein